MINPELARFNACGDVRSENVRAAAYPRLTTTLGGPTIANFINRGERI